MPYWLTEILRRARERGQHADTERHGTSPLRTPEERAQERVAWEQARERVRQRAEKHRRHGREPGADTGRSRNGGGGL
jgi:hypothetical protein